MVVDVPFNRLSAAKTPMDKAQSFLPSCEVVLSKKTTIIQQVGKNCGYFYQ